MNDESCIITDENRNVYFDTIILNKHFLIIDVEKVIPSQIDQHQTKLMDNHFSRNVLNNNSLKQLQDFTNRRREMKQDIVNNSAIINKRIIVVKCIKDVIVKTYQPEEIKFNEGTDYELYVNLDDHYIYNNTNKRLFTDKSDIISKYFVILYEKPQSIPIKQMPYDYIHHQPIQYGLYPQQPPQTQYYSNSIKFTDSKLNTEKSCFGTGIVLFTEPNMCMRCDKIYECNKKFKQDMLNTIKSIKNIVDPIK